MDLIIDKEFKEYIPPLSTDEKKGLESDIIQANKVIVRIETWNNTIIDGHSRYEIATQHNIPFSTIELKFNDRNQVKIYILKKQLHRRNLSDGWKFELVSRLKKELLKVGREKQKQTLGGYKHNPSVLSLNDKTDNHNTQKAIAAELNWSTGKIAQAEYVKNNDPMVWQNVKEQKETVGGAYKKVKKAQNKKKVQPSTIKGNGNVTLFIADCFDIIPTLLDKSINLIIADPPYNKTGYEWDKIGNDTQFLDFIKGWLDLVRPKLTDNYHLFCFCDPDYAAPIEMLLRANNWPIKSRIIWEYKNLV